MEKSAAFLFWVLTNGYTVFIINVYPIERKEECILPRGKMTDDPKVFQTKIRMSEEDIMILDYCVKATGKTKADIIREGIRKVYAELTKE